MFGITEAFKKYASQSADFDSRPDRDYLVDDEWRAPPVAKTILGISDNKRFENDDLFSDIYDDYAYVEADRIADASKMQRWDETASITGGYAKALSDRTRYAATKADEDEYARLKLDMAYRMDKHSARRPQYVSRAAHYSEGTFDDTTDEAPIFRGAAKPGRSRLPSIYGEQPRQPYPWSSTPNLPGGNPRVNCIDHLSGRESGHMSPGPQRECAMIRGRIRVGNGTTRRVPKKEWY